MESTIQIFNQLVEKLPPLMPDDLVYRIRKEVRDLKLRPVSIKELEKMMVNVGYEIWPYNQAFKEFIRNIENRLGEEFLISHLSPVLQAKYEKYRHLNMTWQDVHSGRAAQYFSSEERLEISLALIEMHKFVRKFAEHEAVGMQKDRYLSQVEKFKETLFKIKANLESLRSLAKNESDHPMLANEILARVETFEHGLCLLAPDFDHEEIEQAREFFKGRRLDLGRMRGIHETIEIDFYS